MSGVKQGRHSRKTVSSNEK